MTPRGKHVWLITLSFAAACRSITGPSEEPERHVLAHLSRSGLHGSVDFADGAAPTRLTIQSIGGGCTEAGPVHIARSGGELRITPYHQEPPAGTASPRIHRQITHEVEVPTGIRWVLLNVQVEDEGPTELTYGLGGGPRSQSR